jgi:hypothetical protein
LIGLMPRKPRWYDPLPEATATVNCGGETHHVTWRRGKIVLEDHDLTAEKAMMAFGGEMCPCMRVLEVWVEQFRMPADLFGQMHTWLGDQAFLLPAEMALPRRMGFVRSWERTWRFESYLPTKQAKLLTDELKDKALPALRQHLNAWKAKTGARIVAGCQVVLAPTNQTPAVEGTTDRVTMRATANLHGTWVADVWPHGIAVVDDAFVVDLRRARTLNDLEVVAVRWEPHGSGWTAIAAPARVWRDAGSAGEWRLTWEPA